jgi:polysaccharide deacetylase family protein (PEP-CTERM system associated)
LPYSGPVMSSRSHVLTVVLEDYYHLSPFKDIIERSRWHRFERRLEVGTRKTLALLDEFNTRATFFVLGCVAETAPELVREVAQRGHEVASKGYDHRGIKEMSPALFWEDIHRSREALERATGRTVLGYRVADRWFGPADLWALDMLAQAGYRYDSSMRPLLRDFAGEPWRRFIHQHHGVAGSIWEVPGSSARVMGLQVPIAGGNYFRQFPRMLVRRAIADWDRNIAAPFVMYFHTWELDPDQPRITSASLPATIRQYRNLHRMESILREYLARYSFQRVADHLELRQEILALPRVASPAPVVAPPSHATSTARISVSIVVPCYNEELTLGYLANTLREVEELLAPWYEIEFIFVNDGSQDQTTQTLQHLFGGKSQCVIVDHAENRGVTAATLTGIRTARAEIVCSIDCDCSYDPRELRRMIPMLADGIDLVTASPYHAQGQVRNVPAWRLALSQSASTLYKLICRQRIGTYTSCFRVYRRSVVLELDIREPGYLGIAEIIGKLDLQGGRIAECPATLEARMLGQSKMKTLRTILGHLGLIARLSWLRLRQRRIAPVFRASRPASPQDGRSAGRL